MELREVHVVGRHAFTGSRAVTALVAVGAGDDLVTGQRVEQRRSDAAALAEGGRDKVDRVVREHRPVRWLYDVFPALLDADLLLAERLDVVLAVGRERCRPDFGGDAKRHE